MRLTGLPIASKTGVTFGCSNASAEGRWEPMQMELLRVKHGATEVEVPAASAAVIQLKLSS
jgi:hypothetical protein